MDGSGLSCVDGNGVSGASSTDGKSSVLSQMSRTVQFLPKSSQTWDFLQFASVVPDKVNTTVASTKVMDVFMDTPVTSTARVTIMRLSLEANSPADRWLSHPPSG